MAGRGFGKTRVGGEWIRRQAERFSGCRIALVGRTAADVRDVMVEGESGLLAISPRWFMPKYKPSQRRLVWPNGSMATTYSGDEPAQVRGPQHHFAWGDEVAEWKKPETLENLLLGLRLGNDPRCVLTMTPKPVKHVRDLLKDKSGRVAPTFGTTYENRANLAPTFFDQIVSKYAGTRIGRREIEAILDDDVEGALWKRTLIDDLRVKDTPRLEEIVIAIDPAVTSNAESSETGIIAAGRGANGHGYILDDGSLQDTPKKWAEQAVTLYNKYEANYIVAEANNGGDLVRENIHAVDPNVKVVLVRASRGKFTRAEPISTLYELRKVHHVGSFAWLEDQMCLSGDTLVSTDRGLRRIDTIRPGDKVRTRSGFKRVLWAGQTHEAAEVSKLVLSDGRYLIATLGHPVYTKGRGFVSLKSLRPDDIPESLSWKNMGLAWCGMGGFTPWITMATIAMLLRVSCCIGLFGKKRTAQFRQTWKSITKTLIDRITPSKIFKWYRAPSILPFSTEGLLPTGHSKTTVENPKRHGKTRKSESLHVTDAEIHSPVHVPAPDGVVKSAAEPTIVRVSGLKNKRPVYNLSVEDEHEFYANGILVHNCNWLPGMDSPDRMDALVWALAALMIPRDKDQGAEAYSMGFSGLYGES